VSHNRKRRRKHSHPTPRSGAKGKPNQAIKFTVIRVLIDGAVELILRVAEHFLYLGRGGPQV
jgi:hypothetical protein